MQIFVKTLTGKTITLEVESSDTIAQRQGQNPGQGRHPSGPAAPHLRGEAARGRAHPSRLQHPEGVDAAPGAPPPRRHQGRLHHPGAQPAATRAQVQREENGLPQVLRAASREGNQLPQEEVRPHQPAEAQEEVRQQAFQLKESEGRKKHKACMFVWGLRALE